MTNDQDQIFLTNEGDAWYRRNAAALTAADRPDAILGMVAGLASDWRTSMASVCEVGCASGWRLPRLARHLPGVKRLAGFDASAAAIAEGRRLWPELHLEVGLAHSPPFSGIFDLVVVSFVLHWVDRNNLATTIAAIDRLVSPGGCLVIADFLPARPMRRIYHHRRDVALFTYKQDYAAAFLGLGLYRELARTTYPHEHGGRGSAPCADQDRAACVILHKPEDAYHES